MQLPEELEGLELNSTKDQVKYLFEMLNYPTYKIAKLMGIKEHTVRTYLNETKFGITEPKPKQKSYKEIKKDAERLEKKLGLRRGDKYIQLKDLKRG